MENHNKQEKKEFKTEISYTPASSSINDAIANGVKVSTQKQLLLMLANQMKLKQKLMFQLV